MESSLVDRLRLHSGRCWTVSDAELVSGVEISKPGKELIPASGPAAAVTKLAAGR